MPDRDVGVGERYELWAHVHRTIGTLLHLYEAAPDDTRAIRSAAYEVQALAWRMLAHELPGGGSARRESR